jgi:hypothetical protein
MGTPLSGTTANPQQAASATEQRTKDVPPGEICPNGSLGAFGIFDDPEEPGSGQEDVKANPKINQAKAGWFGRLRGWSGKPSVSAPPTEPSTNRPEKIGIDQTQRKSSPTSDELENKLDEFWERTVLSVDALTLVGKTLDDELKAVGSALSVDKKLISGLWNKLQENTAFHAGKYKLIDSEGKETYCDGVATEADGAAPRSIRDLRNINVPESPQLQLVKKTSAAQQNGVSPAGLSPIHEENGYYENCFDPEKNWHIAETCDQQDETKFIQMLFDTNAALVVDLMPKEEKPYYGLIAPSLGKDKTKDKINVHCQHSFPLIRNVVNFKELRLKQPNSNETVVIERIHAHSMSEVSAVKFNKDIFGLARDGTRVLNRMLGSPLKDQIPVKTLIAVCKEIVALSDQLDKLKKDNPDCKNGIVFHGPDSNGISAMVATMCGAWKEVLDQIDKDPYVVTNEFILRTVFEQAAKSRLYGGPNFIHKKEHFELTVKALLEQFKPYVKLFKETKKSEEKIVADNLAKGFVPGKDLEAAKKKCVALENALGEARNPTDPTKTSKGAGTTAPVDSSGRPKEAEGIPKSPDASPSTAPKPAAPAGSNATGPSIQSPLWEELVKQNKSFEPEELQSCPETGTTTENLHYPIANSLSYKRGNEEVERRLNANKIEFSRDVKVINGVKVSGATAATACAGRSPRRFAACEDFLVKGIESGEGLFQFVSQAAHRELPTSAEKPMIRLLEEKLA